MRIGDWSASVGASDLLLVDALRADALRPLPVRPLTVVLLVLLLLLLHRVVRDHQPVVVLGVLEVVLRADAVAGRRGVAGELLILFVYSHFGAADRTGRAACREGVGQDVENAVG